MLTPTADLVSAAGFPINSSNSNVLQRGDEITLTPTNLAPVNIAQDSDFALLQLSMVTDFNSGGGGALTPAHSSMIVWHKAGVEIPIPTASTPAVAISRILLSICRMYPPCHIGFE